VVPSLTEQCEYVDYSMYHLDGKEEFVHLDASLDIDALDAIEWTPNDGEPLGGDPKWFDLYRRILDAGKSVQAYLVWAHEIVPLLDAIG
ncbi:MAG: cobalamin-binding protein, partial [bacterium]|nr:cobalamin-binding protein [bacterium]